MWNHLRGGGGGGPFFVGGGGGIDLLTSCYYCSAGYSYRFFSYCRYCLWGGCLRIWGGAWIGSSCLDDGGGPLFGWCSSW